MTRGIELINYASDDAGSEGRPMAEANPGGGRKIALREIVDTHSPENADQIYSHLLFVNKLLRATGGKFTLSPEVLFPILTQQQTAVHNTNNFTLFAEFPYSDSTKLGYRFRDALLKELGHPCEVILSDDDDKTILKTVFKMGNHDESAQHLSDHRKNSYIILEEKSDFIGVNYLSLSVVETSGEVKIPDSNSSTTETIFSLEIRQPLSIDNDGVLDWVNDGRADWVIDEEEPHVYLTDKALRVLSQPMSIHNEIYDTAREFFRDKEYYLMKEVFANPNFELVNFPIIFPGRAEERFVRPHYYLDLALLGAKMIKLGILSNKDLFIADESRQMFKQEMLEFKNSNFMNEFWGGKFDLENLSYSPIEYLMYELLWRGVDIWPYMDEFTDSMVQSFKNNPERFWKTVDALGFDQILPVFHGMDEVRRKQFKNILKTDSELALLRRVFSLIPSLAPYYNHNRGKEKDYDQSDEYYMQITLALAAYSHDIGQEQVAAIAVHDGKVIGARRNDTILREGTVEDDRHAERLLIKSLGKELKPGTKLYVTLVPCEICTHIIRRNPKIVEVNCSLGSHSGDIGSLTNPHLREKRRDEKITEEPPLVRIGILENTARNLYIRTNWTQMPIYYGQGIQVIDNRRKKTSQNCGNLPSK